VLTYLHDYVFEVNAVDTALPGAGMDSMTIRLDYRSTESTTRIWLQNLGAELVICNADIGTLTLSGVLTEGEIESMAVAPTPTAASLSIP
jgi:hypothetical protein